MNNNDLISIVIPTHNRIDLLPRALRSALNQTYTNIEVIVVSDGSEDGTDAMMEAFENQDSRVKYIAYHPGRGGNHARNVGIENAHGKYIAFLDDDDEWYPDKLQKQYGLFTSNPKVGLVCTGIRSIHESQSFTTPFIPPAMPDSSKQILLRNCIGSTTTVMVRKDVLSKSGNFDEQLGALQDYDLWVRICQMCEVAVVKEPLVDYYNYDNSNQISRYTDKYEKAVDYLNAKYADLINRLSEDEKRTRKNYFYLLLGKKALRNGQRGKARQYIIKAGKEKLTKEVVYCWAATFFSAKFVRRIDTVKRKLK